MRWSTMIVSTVLAMTSLSVSAHHSGALFERDKTVTVMGTVKEFSFINPHSWLKVEVTDDSGKTVEWLFEAQARSMLMRVGIKAKTFVPGDKITVTANPMRDGSPVGVMTTVVAADGKSYVGNPPR